MNRFEDRHTYLGASELGQVLNLNVAWGTSYELWEQKTLRAPRPPHKDIFDRGHAMESHMEFIMRDRYGVKIYDREKEYRCVGRDWLRSHVDGILHQDSNHMGAGEEIEQEGPGVVEFKAPGSHMARKYAEEGIPEDGQIQIHMNMHNACCKWGVFIVMDYDNWDIIPIYFKYDEHLIDAVFPFIDKFWACVEQDIAPPKREEPYKLMGPSGSQAGAVTDGHLLAADLRDAHVEYEVSKASLDAIKGRIKDAMIKQDIAETFLGCEGVDAKVTWKETKPRVTVDGKKAVAWTQQLLNAMDHQNAEVVNKMISVFNPEMFQKIGKPSMRFTYKIKEEE